MCYVYCPEAKVVVTHGKVSKIIIILLQRRRYSTSVGGWVEVYIHMLFTASYRSLSLLFHFFLALDLANWSLTKGHHHKSSRGSLHQLHPSLDPTWIICKWNGGGELPLLSTWAYQWGEFFERFHPKAVESERYPLNNSVGVCCKRRWIVCINSGTSETFWNLYL